VANRLKIKLHAFHTQGLKLSAQKGKGDPSFEAEGWVGSEKVRFFFLLAADAGWPVGMAYRAMNAQPRTNPENDTIL
jgi:hypothetical protein